MDWSSTLVQHLLRAEEDNMMNRFHTFAYTCSKLSEQEKTTWYHCGVLFHQESLWCLLFEPTWVQNSWYTYVYTPSVGVIFDTNWYNPIGNQGFEKSHKSSGKTPKLDDFFEGTILGSCQVASGFWSFPEAGKVQKKENHRLTKWHLSANMC